MSEIEYIDGVQVGGEYGIRAAFERMYICGNKDCSAYGEDTPDWCENDRQQRCLMCGVAKVHWSTIPELDICNSLHRSLVKLGLVA